MGFDQVLLCGGLSLLGLISMRLGCVSTLPVRFVFSVSASLLCLVLGYGGLALSEGWVMASSLVPSLVGGGAIPATFSPQLAAWHISVC
jgi:hypothetical protein